MKFVIIDPYLSGLCFYNKNNEYKIYSEGEIELMGVMNDTGIFTVVDYHGMISTISQGQYKIIKVIDHLEKPVNKNNTPNISLRDLLGQDIKSIEFQ